MVASVPVDASKVQVKADPDTPDEEKVAFEISVVSRLTVTVPALSTVSIPLVPPAMVRVPPKEVADDPESPANVILPEVNWETLICPDPVMICIPLTTNAESHPLPMDNAVELIDPPGSVKLPILIPLTLSVPAELVGAKVSSSIPL